MNSQVTPIQKGERKFSKRVVIANNVAGWTVLVVAALMDQLAAVIAFILPFNLALIGIYTGIGHMDYRKVLEVTRAEADRYKKVE